MSAPISKDWCEAVVKVLETYDKKRIEWTFRASQDWQAATGGFESDAYPGIIAALKEDGIEGIQTTSLPPGIEDYEFFFFHNGRKFYGKISLLAGRLKVRIISAHPPLKKSGL